MPSDTPLSPRNHMTPNEMRRAKQKAADRWIAKEFRHQIRRSLSLGVGRDEIHYAVTLGLTRAQMRRLVHLLTGTQCHD